MVVSPRKKQAENVLVSRPAAVVESCRASAEAVAVAMAEVEASLAAVEASWSSSSS